MINNDIINYLIGLWVDTSKCYSKSKDFYFEINILWKYKDLPVYIVNHNGYLNEYTRTFNTINEAEIYLINILVIMIELQIEDIKLHYEEDYSIKSIEQSEEIKDKLLNIISSCPIYTNDEKNIYGI